MSRWQAGTEVPQILHWKKKVNASEKSKKKLAEISLLIVTLELISYFTYIQLILSAEFSIWKFEQGFNISVLKLPQI